MAAAAGITLDPWQLEAVTSPARQVLICAGRQVGKSLCAALCSLSAASRNPGSLVLLVAPALRQSLELFRSVKTSLRAADGFALVEGETQLKLELANGSRIIAVPGNNESTIRGYAAQLLVVDEAARIKDELLYALKPMTAVTQGRLWMISSPFGKRGAFYEAWENGGGDYERYHIPSDRCPRISREFLEAERRQMPDLYWRSEYLAEFVDIDGAVFLSSDVDRLLVDQPVEQGWWS